MRTNYLGTFFLVLLVGGCSGYREPTPPKVAELTAMLNSADANEQMIAAAWVKQLGPRAAETAPALIAALKSADAGVRQSAAAALGEIGVEAAAATVPALTAALDDPEPAVQKAAVNSLGQFGPAASSAIPALEKMSTRPDPCGAAPNALKKIRS